ncbi:hypothetical protein Tco_0801698 [Tanacetum coccineum]|uniref:Uncharacterized protein n=1 Tax=Tanacetum coccineum TaxID=301880 RepID=A0ABQ4ZXL6_9ASTR
MVMVYKSMVVQNKLDASNLVLALKQESMKYMIKNMFGLRWNCKELKESEAKIYQDGNVAENKEVKESKKANLWKLLRYGFRFLVNLKMILMDFVIAGLLVVQITGSWLLPFYDLRLALIVVTWVTSFAIGLLGRDRARFDIKNFDGNGVQKHGCSKQKGCKQLGPDIKTRIHGVHDQKHVWFEVELQGAQGNREAKVIQVSNNNTAVSQR